MGYKNFLLVSDYSSYWCACGRKPSLDRITCNQCSIWVTHSKNSTCTYNTKYKFLFRATGSIKINQAQTRKILVESVFEYDIPLSVVSEQSFQKILIFRSGHSNLKAPSRCTMSTDIGNRFMNIYNGLEALILSSVQSILITLDLWSNCSEREFPTQNDHAFKSHWKPIHPLLRIALFSKSTKG